MIFAHTLMFTQTHTNTHTHMHRQNTVNSSHANDLDTVHRDKEGCGFDYSPLGQREYYHNIWYQKSVEKEILLSERNADNGKEIFITTVLKFNHLLVN